MDKKIKFCPKCHHAVKPSMKFCPNCGYYLVSIHHIKHSNKKNNKHKHQIHHFKRMQHTKIQQPSISEWLKLKFDDLSGNNNENHKHVHYSLKGSMKHIDACIAGTVIVLILIILGCICISDSGSRNDSQHYSSNKNASSIHTSTKTSNNNSISEHYYPIKHVWSAMQDDLNNRAVKRPYARYFVNGRLNNAYTSLVSWKANIFSSTPSTYLSGIKTKPERFHYKRHHINYDIKYEFPQNDDKKQIQVYKWHAIIHGHRIYSMYSNSEPSINKFVNK